MSFRDLELMCAIGMFACAALAIGCMVIGITYGGP